MEWHLKLAYPIKRCVNSQVWLSKTVRRWRLLGRCTLTTVRLGHGRVRAVFIRQHSIHGGQPVTRRKTWTPSKRYVSVEQMPSECHANRPPTPIAVGVGRSDRGLRRTKPQGARVTEPKDISLSRDPSPTKQLTQAPPSPCPYPCGTQKRYSVHSGH